MALHLFFRSHFFHPFASLAFAAILSSAAAAADGDRVRQRLAELHQRIESLSARAPDDMAAAAVLAHCQVFATELEHALMALPQHPTASGSGSPRLGVSPASDQGGIAATPLPAPPGCTALTNSTASNSTDVVIPTTADTPVISSIFVSSLRPWINEMSVTISLTHPACNQLDITLTSPEGTICTLTTDNGNGADNFTLTGFFDRADPSGPLPYGANPLLVTDRIFSTGVSPIDLVPEEGFAVFAGENPNGIWTLTINDDTAGSGGTLTNWAITFLHGDRPGFATTRTVSGSPNLVIPTGPAVLDSSLNISGLGSYVCDVDVFVDIDHANTADLDLALISPFNTVVTLSTDNGAGDNNFAGTLFDAQADRNGQLPYSANAQLATDHFHTNNTVLLRTTSEESLGAFNGENPNGAWTLRISDDAASNGGLLNSWAVTVTTCACEPGCQGDVTGDGLTDILDLTEIILGWGCN